jgi:hypothetical protein
MKNKQKEWRPATQPLTFRVTGGYLKVGTSFLKRVTRKFTELL